MVPSTSHKITSKSVTLLVVMAVVLLFGGLFAYVACSGKLKTASTELEAKQKEVENSRKIAQRLEEAEVNYAQAKAQIEYLEQSVSKQAYIPTLLKQLELLGKEVNLKVVGVRPVVNQASATPTRKLSTDSTNPEAAAKQMDQNSQQGNKDQQGQKPAEKPYDPLDINIEVEGSYQNTMSFLYKITRFPKIMSVNSVEIAPMATLFGTGAPTLQVKLNLTAYVFREEKKPVIPVQEPAPVTSRAQFDWRHDNEAG